MRGHVPDLDTPHPLGLTLPAVYHEDDLAQRFLAGLDEVLSPVISTIDNFHAYIDPRLAPEDFLPWLAGWVGLELDEHWPVARRRRLIAIAGELFSRRGTALGLRQLLEVYTAGDVEVTETGGCTWSPSPGAEPPGEAVPRVTVRVRPAAGRPVDEEQVRTLVARATPAHVIHEVEVVSA